MFFTSQQRAVSIWFFFILLLLMLMFPVGCSSKKSHTEVEGGKPGTLGGQVAVKPEDQTNLAGKIPEQSAASADLKQEAESEKPGCEYPLKIEMNKGVTNLSELVDSYPVFGWAVGFIEGGEPQQIEACGFYLRLALIANCKDEVVKAGQPTGSLRGVFETNLLGSVMYFEGDLGILVNRLPRETLFQFKSSFLLQDQTGLGDSQPLKMQFLRVPDMGIPNDAFGMRIPGLINPNQPFGDLDAYVAISSSKRDAAPYAAHGTFRVLPMEISACRAFPLKLPLPEHLKKDKDGVPEVSETPVKQPTPPSKKSPSIEI